MVTKILSTVAAMAVVGAVGVVAGKVYSARRKPLTPRERLELARAEAAKAFDAYMAGVTDMTCKNWEPLKDAYHVAAAKREAAFQAVMREPVVV
jgi:hypothetical protein